MFSILSSVLQYSTQQLANLPEQVPTQYCQFGFVIRNNQNKLGNQALKSELKSTEIAANHGRNGGNKYDPILTELDFALCKWNPRGAQIVRLTHKNCFYSCH